MNITDDLWELVQFYAHERILLHSFLDYLASPPPPSMEAKRGEILGWRKHIGLQLGNPHLDERLNALFEKFRDGTPQEAQEALQGILASARASYFSSPDSPT